MTKTQITEAALSWFSTLSEDKKLELKEKYFDKNTSLTEVYIKETEPKQRLIKMDNIIWN